MNSQDKSAKLVRQLVNNRMKVGYTQEQAIEAVTTCAQSRGSTITKAFVYWAVTGRYL